MLFDWLLQRSNIFLFVSAAALAFAAIVVVHPFTLINGDEGIYIQDAMLLGRGMVPIADFDSRTPILLFLISFFSTLFGPSIFVFRLPVILATALTAGVLYLLGKELFSKKIGILAGLLYALNPYVLWSDIVLKSEMLTILFGTIGIYFIVRAVKEERSLFYFAAGCMAGFAFLERHSGIVIVFVIAMLFFWQKRNRVKAAFASSLGFIAGFAPIFGFIAYHNAERAMRFWFGISYDLITLQADRSTAASSGIFSYAVWRDWGLLMVEDLAPQAWVLFPVLVFFLSIASCYFLRARWRLPVVAGIMLIFYGAFVEHALGVYFTEPDLRPEVFLLTLIATLVITVPLGYFFWNIRDRVTDLYSPYIVAFIVLISWMAGLVGLYTFWTPTYLRELVVPMTLAAAFILYECGSYLRDYTLRVFFGVGIAGLYISSLWWFANPLTGGWWWKQETMKEAAVYLERDTRTNEEVFSANPLPLMLINRRTFGDISSYSIIHAPRFEEAWGHYPAPAELFARLQKEPPRYVIVDQRMVRHIYAPAPAFKEFVLANYAEVVSFGEGKDETQIWKRK